VYVIVHRLSAQGSEVLHAGGRGGRSAAVQSWVRSAALVWHWCGGRVIDGDVGAEMEALRTGVGV